MAKVPWTAFNGVDHEESVYTTGFISFIPKRKPTAEGEHGNAAVLNFDTIGEPDEGKSSPRRDVVVSLDGLPIRWVADYNHFDSYLTYVAEVGESPLPWKRVQPAIIVFLKPKILEVVKIFKKICKMKKMTKLAAAVKKREDLENRLIFNCILNKFERFVEFPCTFSRFCEMLVDPAYHANTITEFMRELQKTVDVDVILPSMYAPGPNDPVEDLNYGVGPLYPLREGDEGVDDDDPNIIVKKTPVFDPIEALRVPQLKKPRRPQRKRYTVRTERKKEPKDTTNIKEYRRTEWDSDKTALLAQRHQLPSAEDRGKSADIENKAPEKKRTKLYSKVTSQKRLRNGDVSMEKLRGISSYEEKSKDIEQHRYELPALEGDSAHGPSNTCTSDAASLALQGTLHSKDVGGAEVVRYGIYSA